MITQDDWRSIAVILANNVVTLAGMIRESKSMKPETLEKMKEIEERCAEMIAFATIQKGKQ